MENRLLKYFLVVAREENITRAAEMLHISQPALSRQLMQLEEELGVQLFVRGKRSVTLTSEGAYRSYIPSALSRARTDERHRMEKASDAIACRNQIDRTYTMQNSYGQQ